MKDDQSTPLTLHSPSYTMRVPSDFWLLIDAWRKLQPDLPSRAEAVRRLVAAGLNATPKGTPPCT
jgi:hypothetical protein